MDKSCYKNMWVHIEHENGKVSNASLELCCEVRRLCDESGDKLIGVAAGSIPESEMQRIKECGADGVISVSGTGYDRYSTEAYSNLYVELSRKYLPSAVFIAATANGRDFAPHFAACLETGCTSDATELIYNPETKDIEFVEPAAGGKIMAVITIPVLRPQVGTIRPGTFKLAPGGCREDFEVIREHIDFDLSKIRTKLLERIASETGSPVCDIMFGGGVDSLESYKGYFSPYQSPEEAGIDPAFLSEDHMWAPFSILPTVIIYNQKLVPAHTVTGWRDLIDPRWKGKIAFADPSASGSSYTALATLCQIIPKDTERQFAKNLGGSQFGGSGDVVKAVADGTCFLGITLEETAMKRIAEGYDIKLLYPAEGTSAVPDGSALIKGAPHEDNAKLFLDFVLSRGAQERLARQFYRRPVCSDIQRQKELSPLEDIALIDYSVSWASENHDHMLERWSALMEQEAGR